MATAASALVPVTGKGKIDGRKANGGTRVGAGRKEWQPARETREFRRGIFRQESQDEAWSRVRQEVRHLVAMGVPLNIMGGFMAPPISENTLTKHFQWELTHGKMMQNVRMGGVAFAMGMSGRHPDMTRFWLRTQAGWSEKVDIQVNGPIQFQLIDGDELE